MRSFDPHRSKKPQAENGSANGEAHELQGLTNELPETCKGFMQDNQDQPDYENQESNIAGQDDQSHESRSRQADRNDSRDKQLFYQRRSRTEEHRVTNHTRNERRLHRVFDEHDVSDEQSPDDIEFALQAWMQKKHRDNDREFTMDYPSFYEQHRR